MTPDQQFCRRCGNSLAPGTRFCDQCGAPVDAPQPSGGAAPPSAPAEPIVNVIPMQQRSGFMGVSVKSFNMIVTPQRLILIPITKQEIDEAVRTAREQARAAGKGFFGQWGAQLAWMQVLYERYRATPVERLAQTPGCTVIWNQEVRSVRLKDPPALRAGVSRDYDEKTYPTIELETTRGRFKFELLTMKAREVRPILQETLGAVVR